MDIQIGVNTFLPMKQYICSICSFQYGRHPIAELPEGAIYAAYQEERSVFTQSFTMYIEFQGDTDETTARSLCGWTETDSVGMPVYVATLQETTWERSRAVAWVLRPDLRVGIIYEFVPEIR
jgi:hypothetical protein